MKKVTAVLAVMILVVSLFSLAFAADAGKKVVVKSVDAKAATMVVTGEDGKDATMSVDKAVDISKVKAGDKVMITVDKDVITSCKAARSKQAVGC
jgi:hypothetical protein